MSLKKTIQSIPKDSHGRQAFRSPFRSPRPSNNNSLDTEKSPAEGQTSASGGVHVNWDKSQTNGERIVTGELKTGTSSKSLVLSSCTTQRASVRHRDFQRKVFPRQFNSPFRSPGNKIFKHQLETSEQLADLIKQEADLDKEITALKESGIKVEELQDHIDNLHRYNDMKDAAQLVLGRLAELEQVTLKEIHKKYKVPLSE